MNDGMAMLATGICCMVVGLALLFLLVVQNDKRGD